MNTDFSALASMFNPKSVAIVGATDDPRAIGGRPIITMQQAGYQGKILPINPKRKDVFGIPCFASVADLPQAPDVALVGVRASSVLNIVDQLGQRGCKGVTLFSAGFSELGAEGAALQKRILDTAHGYNMRLLGPNSLGGFNASAGYYGTFASTLDNGLPRPGNIGIATQSGSFGAHLVTVARNRGMGNSIFIATGNEADLSVGDAIGWMAGHGEIDVICAYLEGVNKPEVFLSSLETARKAKKPVFVTKVGRSEAGATAARSHTASLAGNDAVFDAVLREYGAIRVDNTDQMMDYAYCARRRIFPVKNTFALVTLSGAAGVIASDECDVLGLPMPPMPLEAQKKLKELLPISVPVNPIDCTASAMVDLSLLEKFTRSALHDGGYKSLMGFFTYVANTDATTDRLIASLSPFVKEFPDRLFILGIIAEERLIRRYEAAGFLCFEEPARAVRAAHAMGVLGDMYAADDAGREAPALPPIAEVVVPAATPDEYNAKRLMHDAGIAIAPEQVATTMEQAVAAAKAIGYPVVMKILSADILHKSDIGGVKLGIDSDAAAMAAYEAVMTAASVHAPQARVSGVLVAKQLSGGVECFMGIQRDPAFGLVAAFGLGGIFVEIMKDVALHRCPLDKATAREMISSIKGAKILAGARGRPEADIDALADTLSRLSVFADKAGERLKAVDLNPVLAMPKGQGAYMLDAVIELGEK
jgi:acyl-CoA synthetase (NDP forming)